jgi:hypothetical protein
LRANWPANQPPPVARIGCTLVRKREVHGPNAAFVVPFVFVRIIVSPVGVDRHATVCVNRAKHTLYLAIHSEDPFDLVCA